MENLKTVTMEQNVSEGGRLIPEKAILVLLRSGVPFGCLSGMQRL